MRVCLRVSECAYDRRIVKVFKTRNYIRVLCCRCMRCCVRMFICLCARFYVCMCACVAVVVRGVVVDGCVCVDVVLLCFILYMYIGLHVCRCVRLPLCACLYNYACV